MTGSCRFGTLDLSIDCQAPGVGFSYPGLSGPKKMIKSELIERIAERYPHLFVRDVEKIVNAILEEISGALERGDRVELRGFGAFSVKHRDPRDGRNPRTGEAVAVESKNVPFFKTGKDMRKRLNEKHQA